MNISKKNRHSFLLLGILLFSCFILFLKNPSNDDFQRYLKSELTEKAYEKNKISGLMMELLSDPLSWIISLNVEREDYIVFSVYHYQILDEEKKFIGIANHFFPL